MNDKLKPEPQPAEPTAVPSSAITLHPLLPEMTQKIVRLGQTTLSLYVQGEVTHAAIAPLCDALLEMEQKLLPLPQELTAIPLPAPPEETAAAVTPELAPPPMLTHCPQCHTAVVPGKKFCTNCGLRLVPTDQTPPAAPALATNAEMVHNAAHSAPFIAPPPLITTPPSPAAALAAFPAGKCPTCGVDLIPNAAFCTNCGHPLISTSQPASTPTQPAQPPIVANTVPYPPLPNAPADPIAKYCQTCGKGVSANVVVCAECGGRNFDAA